MSMNANINSETGTPPAGQLVDIEPILAKITVPANLKSLYDKAVISGLRIAFDRNSHEMLIQQLEKPGDLLTKMVEGVVSLMYLLYQQSNRTLPPALIVPICVALTLKIFDFLQKSGEEQATKELLGEAMSQIIEKVLQGFGASQEQILQLVKQNQGAAGSAGPVSGARK